MNLDELLKSMFPEGIQSMGMDLNSATSQCTLASSLQHQGSITMPRTLSKKMVDEVWRDIQQGQQKSNKEQRSGCERQLTLGEMTLEDEVSIVEFPMVINTHDGPKDENCLSKKPTRRFTRSAIKAKEEDFGAGETATASCGSVGSVVRKAEANSENGSLNSTPKKKMELKMSKKNCPDEASNKC